MENHYLEQYHYLHSMKNHILFTLIGGVILFIWGFLSWAGINFHIDEQAYTPLETEILSAIAETGLEPGMYALGQGDATLGQEGQISDWEANFKGKPWGVLNYIETADMSMGLNLFRGFSMNLFVTALLFMILNQIKELDYKKSIMICVGIGLITFMMEFYNGYIWFKSPGIYAHLIDAIIPWTFLGMLGGKFASSTR
ncbi:MAG: hypothetical protein COA49_06965 [Bacteroidetes bacterium]|nr:MAG: hypothetical protein COA49_06965 [Bacteroidota bacterium]